MAGRSFFVEPGAIQGERAELHGTVAHQIRNVLRLHPGDALELLDNSGYAYAGRLTEVSKEAVVVEVLEKHRSPTEPSVELWLYQALLKGDKMEWVLQKGTEIGVSRFVPVLSERCISRPSPADVERRLRRWETIVREAAEQSGRAVLPLVSPLKSFEAACAEAGEGELGVMAWEEERALGIGEVVRQAGMARSNIPIPGPSLIKGEGGAGPLPPSVGEGTGVGGPQPGQGVLRQRVALLVGPEGGFSPREAEIAKGAGLRIVSLGPRILRAETASLVAATLVLCNTGDLGG